MNNKLKSPTGMSPAGAGPKIFAKAIPFLVIGIIIGIWFPRFSRFMEPGNSIVKIIGISGIVIGLSIYFLAMRQFLKEFSKGKLIISGVYRFSRNPLYASWILFVFPGLSILCNNWWFMVSAVSMCIALVTYVRQEEELLLKVFGQQYEDYKKKVGRIGFFPKFF